MIGRALILGFKSAFYEKIGFTFLQIHKKNVILALDLLWDT